MKRLVIDVSKHNGVIDWNKVKASGVKGVMVRAGWTGYEGELHEDERAADNIYHAHKAGLDVGLYVYTYNLTKEAAIRSANEVCSFADRFSINMPIAYDIEDSVYYEKNRGFTKTKLTEMVRTFCEEVKDNGYHPMWYTYPSFIQYCLKPDELNDYDLWIAHYLKNDLEGNSTMYEDKATMWQFIGDKGHTDGIIGGCDRSWCYVDYPAIITGKPSEINNKTLENLIQDLTKVIDKYK